MDNPVPPGRRASAGGGIVIHVGGVGAHHERARAAYAKEAQTVAEGDETPSAPIATNGAPDEALEAVVAM